VRSEPRNLSGWGRYEHVVATAYLPEHRNELESSPLPPDALIGRGLGRSYGDAAQLAKGSVVITTECAATDWVDRDAGVIRADAGVTIGQIIDRFTPKGWFAPVTPGTRLVTVGGAIAADIHGKNHHVDGSFVDHVRSFRLRLASDEILTVSPAQNAEVFWATAGGMGLTGIIIDAVIGLTAIPSSSVAVRTARFSSLQPLLDEMRAQDAEHDFSVAWVDLLRGARSVLTQGSFATPSELEQLSPASDAAGVHQQPSTLGIGLPPIPLPRVAITPGVKVFNELWWRKAPAEPTTTAESITAFFHPLDAIRDWNRVYGRSGFVQWQCVVPDDDNTLFELISRFAWLPSYFTVLKRFGSANQGPLSFPAPGWTLAVDLPATRKALDGLVELDHIVADAGGRIYLAKDARMQRAVFEPMYPRLGEFKRLRAQLDPQARFASDLSLRLGL